MTETEQTSANDIIAGLEFLAEASEVVTESLDFEETLHRISHIAVPRFAQGVIVYLTDADGKLQRQVVAAADPKREAAVQEMWARYPLIESGPLRRVIDTGESWVTRDMSEETWSFIPDPEQRRLVAGIGVRSIVAAPMRTRDETFGTILFARTQERSFEPFEVIIAEDIARRAAGAIERSRLYTAERRAREEAERASRAKDEFLAILSHELRTPLTTVLGWADLLKMTYKGPDESIAFAIESLRTSAATQARLIDDLLDVTRIITGKLGIEKRPSELTEIVRIAAESMRLVADSKKIALEVDAYCCIDVDADPARMHQVIINLVANAIKFTPDGGRVLVSVRRRDGEADIVVADNGVGISKEFLPHVFERFRQASVGDSRTHTGLGLGLSIVQHLVQLHGGRVRAESEGPGKGARFTVTLPVKAM